MDENEVNKLEAFFNKTVLPNSVELEPGTRIINLPRFIESHLNVLKYGNKSMSELFGSRLQRLRVLLENK